MSTSPPTTAIASTICNCSCRIMGKERTKCYLCTESPEEDSTKVLMKVFRYCSDVCLNKQKEDHAEECSILRHRRALLRTMNLVREIFYVYREHTFERVLKQTWFEDTERKIVVQENKYSQLQITQDLVKGLPKYLGMPKNVKDAVLAYLTPDAADIMNEIVGYAFRGLVQDMQLRKVKSESRKSSRVVLCNMDGKDIKLRDRPTIYQMTTNDGSKYAFDLTGARWSKNDNNSLRTWSDWKRRHNNLKLVEKPLGTRLVKLEAMSKIPVLPYLLFKLDTEAAQVVLYHILDMEKNTLGTSLYDLRMLSNKEDYDKKVSELLAGIADVLILHKSRCRLEQTEKSKEAVDDLVIRARRESLSFSTELASHQKAHFPIISRTLIRKTNDRHGQKKVEVMVQEIGAQDGGRPTAREQTGDEQPQEEAMVHEVGAQHQGEQTEGEKAEGTIKGRKRRAIKQLFQRISVGRWSFHARPRRVAERS